MTRKKVLVVDDSLSARQEATSVLYAGGFDVIHAVDGIEGLARIAATDDLAAVVADITMPRMSGLEMLAQIKQDPRYVALPIIMLTTEGQPDLIRRAKDIGAKGWMVKPFKPELLIALVRKFTATAVLP